MRRLLRALQIEVTSRCSRKCKICPRFFLGKDWQEGDLSEETFRTIEKDFHLVEHVHLQGWGEPLLHPRLSDWAERAWKAGCAVGITTNGDGLEKALFWLMEGYVSHITVSIAGSVPTNKKLRGGSDIEAIFSSVSLLAKQFKASKVKTRIQISYLLTQKNHPEISEIVRKAGSAGADEIFVIHLDYCANSSLQDMAAYKQDSLGEGVKESLAEAEKVARQIKISFRKPCMRGEDVLVCALNPIHQAFISWQGFVGPCVNLLLPVSSGIPRWSPGDDLKIKPVIFGKINPASLQDVLNSSARREFNQAFQERMEAERRFLLSLDMEPGFRSLEKLELADQERTQALEKYPFPESCRFCPKARGW